MAKVAVALHLVEKGGQKENRQRVAGSSDEWDTGTWWVGDKTAKQLQGRMIYLHSSQDSASHIGGHIISVCQASEDPKRKVFRFRESADCSGVQAPASGWGNEKCVVWAQ